MVLRMRDKRFLLAILAKPWRTKLENGNSKLETRQSSIDNRQCPAPNLNWRRRLKARSGSPAVRIRSIGLLALSSTVSFA